MICLCVETKTRQTWLENDLIMDDKVCVTHTHSISGYLLIKHLTKGWYQTSSWSVKNTCTYHLDSVKILGKGRNNNADDRIGDNVDNGNDDNSNDNDDW